MMKAHFIGGLATLTTALSAASAFAQTPLVDGKVIQGSLEAPCFALSAQYYTHWIITLESEFNGMVEIGRGSSCSDAEWFRSGSPLEFRGGGGRYMLRVRDRGAPSSGAFTLKTELRPAVPGQRITRKMDQQLVARGDDIALPRAVSQMAATGAGKTTGEIFQDCEACPSMVVVPAGSFMMGSPPDEAGRTTAEGPRHVVTLTRAFAVGRHEVTVAQYEACARAGACPPTGGFLDQYATRPIEYSSYASAVAYVSWLSDLTGHAYSLPTEAEWEYVARAGTDTPWNTGSAVLTDDANIMGQFGTSTPVGGYPPNAFGLYDTIGNASEWVQDCLDTGYVGAPDNGAAVRSGDCASQGIVRGGDYMSKPGEARSAARGVVARRGFPAPAARVGFRVTRAL